MKLSIIVPVYNMAADEKLNFCIESLLNQTVSDYEILLVDDCSTDNSYSVMQEYAGRFPERIRIFKDPENLHQGGARNTGLREARGEWIGFMDSDDWASPHMFEHLLIKAEETGADVVGCDYNLVHSHTYQVGEIIQNNTQEQTGVLDEEKYRKLVMRPGSMVIKIYRADVIREHHLTFPEKIFYEDNAAAPYWMVHFQHFEKLDEPLYYYYQFEQSTVHQVTRQKCEDRLASGELLIDYFDKAGMLEQYVKELEYRFTEIYYANTLFSYVQGVKHVEMSFLRKLKKGMKKRFPRFEENPYYQKNYDAEQKKLMHYHMQSCTFFLTYYKLLRLFRRLFRS